MKQVQRHLFFSLLLSAGVIGTDPPHPSSTQTADSKNLQIVPPCQVCRILVNSFQKGFEATARGKHEGGNTGWEESRLGNYADSEIRLVEIQEKLCSDSTRAQTQCQALVEEYESVLEDWWFHKRRENPDLHEFLCINVLKVCCPDNHYGPDCKPCSNGTEKPCSGHGHCKGSGTRKGSGKCKCDEGYKDINECLELEGDPCKGNSFCANTEGSYTCIEKAVQDRTLHAELARYSTYLGLSIATCIIFRRNILLASVIGVLVATYIGLSEYTLGEWNRSSLGKYFNTWLSK
ncbi:protein disulfide isomerase Creld1-like isoform X4 [Tachypleus tridentatus]|uniref:protein disulfide isomerase Creld1-like isoform X4 n=1 Tax=Tachypleus tridentatus TaxID=6853 RepID=UPI003FD4EA4A